MSYLEYAHLPPGRRSRLATLLQRTHGRSAVLRLDDGRGGRAGTGLGSPDVAEPHYAFQLAAEAGFSAIACSIGIADTYLPDYAEMLPLILDVNPPIGRSDPAAVSGPVTASVEDALRLNAQALGYSLPAGMAMRDQDYPRVGELRREAHRFGLPLILWADTSRGVRSTSVDRDPVGTIETTARAALELGADLVCLDMPPVDADRQEEASAAMARVARAAAAIPFLASLDPSLPQDATERVARLALDAGAVGIVVGQHGWPGSFPAAVAGVARMHTYLQQ